MHNVLLKQQRQNTMSHCLYVALISPRNGYVIMTVVFGLKAQAEWVQVYKTLPTWATAIICWIITQLDHIAKGLKFNSFSLASRVL